jgi:hypothetical protein
MHFEVVEGGVGRESFPKDRDPFSALFSSPAQKFSSILSTRVTDPTSLAAVLPLVLHLIPQTGKKTPQLSAPFLEPHILKGR